MVSAKKQWLLCCRETPKGSGIEHTRCLWRCICRVELKTELVAILYKVNSNLLITSPSLCNQAVISPLHPSPTSTPKRWLLIRGPELQRSGEAKAKGEGNWVRVCPLMGKTSQCPPPFGSQTAGDSPLPEDYRNLSGNQLDWPSDTDSGEAETKWGIPVCSTCEKGHWSTSPIWKVLTVTLRKSMES